MKKLLYLILIFLPIVMQAGPVTAQQALEKARRFMKGKEIVMPTHVRGTTKVTKNNMDAFYVFNATDDGGYVIVSADDRTPDILAYSDTGHLDLTQMPDNMKYWFDYLALSVISVNEVTSVKKNPSLISKANIPPLIQTAWHQDAPYNEKCPVLGVNGVDMHCKTGCVATAMSQVMNYWQHPQVSDTIPGYEPKRGPSSPTLPKFDFKWTQLQTTDSLKAWLMRYCGQSVQMEYWYDSSGATDGLIPKALVNYFSYDKSSHCIFRGGYTAEAWDSIIYRELAEGRPVIYNGITPDSIHYGHSFICDGFEKRDEVGYYHVNWGWGQRYNNYTLLSLMDSQRRASGVDLIFSQGQSAVIGIKPDEGGTDDYKKLTITNMDVLSDPVIHRDSSIYFSCLVQFSLTTDTLFEVDFQLVAEGKNQRFAGSNPYQDHVSPGQQLNLNSCISINRNVPDGVYMIKPRYRLVGDKIGFRPLEGDDVNYIQVIVRGDTMILRSVSNAEKQNEGDVNGDGLVTEEDILPILESISKSQYLISADLNNDGVITVADVIALMNIFNLQSKNK